AGTICRPRDDLRDLRGRPPGCAGADPRRERPCAGCFHTQVNALKSMRLYSITETDLARGRLRRRAGWLTPSGLLSFLPFEKLAEQHFSVLILAQELLEHASHFAPHVGRRHADALGGRHPDNALAVEPFLRCTKP